MNASDEVDVVVCGAGIGGLTAAAALRQRGINVTVLEQADEVSELGAGLQIGPNASRVLLRLGITLDEVALVVQESVWRRWEDGSIISKTTLGSGAIATYGAPYLQMHRVDLHRLLLEAATDPSRPGRPVTIETGQQVVSVDETDPTRPAAVTANGRSFAASVVIGAEGVRSVVRSHIGAPGDVLDSGHMAFRCLIDGAAVRDDPATRLFTDWQAANVWLGDDRHIIAYPVRHFGLVNLVAVVPITADVDELWRRPASRDELVASYPGWDARVGALLAKAPQELMLWALKYQEPHAQWCRGHVALLGDACHAMVPYVSQGASQAIEDGYVLAEELALASADTIAAALASYTQRRSGHAATVQTAALANRTTFHLPDGDGQRARDLRMRTEHRAVNDTLDRIYSGTPLLDDPVLAGNPT